MFWKTLVAAFFLVGIVAADLELNEDHKTKLKEKLKEQCDRVGAPATAADDVAGAVVNFVNCLKGIINVEDLKKEIEEAKPRGALDEVFKKYCAKSPEIKTCISNVLDSASPCLDDTSKAHIGAAKNGTGQLIDFVCYKDGDRIALFIAEKGPECFAAKQEAIRECGKPLQNNLTPESAAGLSMADRCKKFDELSTCIVTALESCDTPTPGNMAESLFKFVRKSSPCKDALPKN